MVMETRDDGDCDGDGDEGDGDDDGDCGGGDGDYFDDAVGVDDLTVISNAMVF